MKSAYHILCALLCVTITLALPNGEKSDGTVNETAVVPPSPVQQLNDTGKIDNVTTAVPPNTISSTTPSITSSMTTSSNTTNSTTSTTTTAPTTINTTTKAPTTSTTAEPTKPTNVTTTPTPTPTKGTTTSSSTALPHTTAIPSVPSPSRDRQFDGLSFFGGIILATCLMAISVFAWKFYRQCNEGNYRTL